MSDLFADSPQVIVLPGSGAGCELHYFPQFIDKAEADRLLMTLEERVAWRQGSIRIGGREVAIPRLNAWYGDVGADYGYSGIRLPTNPWFNELQTLRRQVEQAARHNFNSALLNLYRDGRDSVAWHSDDESELGNSPVIASVSLGAVRRFQLRQRQGSERFALELEHGSLLVMAGATQHHWQHQLPKQPSVVEPRINITFRTILKR